jgi:hypothetical protein
MIRPYAYVCNNLLTGNLTNLKNDCLFLAPNSSYFAVTTVVANSIRTPILKPMNPK